MPTILVLTDFREMDTREQEMLLLIGSNENQIILDVSEATIFPESEGFEDFLFFSRIARETANRRGHHAPKIIVVMPKQNTKIWMERIKKLIDKAGLDIELASSLDDAKVAFNSTSEWRILKAKPGKILGP